MMTMVAMTAQYIILFRGTLVDFWKKYNVSLKDIYKPIAGLIDQTHCFFLFEIKQLLKHDEFPRRNLARGEGRGARGRGDGGGESGGDS